MSNYNTINQQIPLMKHSNFIKNNKFIIESFTKDDLFLFQYYMDRFEAIAEKTGEKKPITIEIQTGGGSAYVGYGIISRLEEMKEKDYEIITKANGFCFSMGAMVLMVGTKRYASRRSDIMIHAPYNYQDPYTPSTLKSKKQELELSEKMITVFKDILKQYTKIPPEEFQSWADSDDDKWLNPKEALECGVIDEIL